MTAPSFPSLPLRGVSVVEAGTYITAPFAGLMLAQLGAEVTKVEPPSGDPFRRFALRHRGLSAAWVNVNQGKANVAMDLKDPADQSRMQTLLDDADVFIQNWRPGVAESLGLDPDRQLEAHPRLIYVSISGYGTSGANADAPVFDTILQASTGLSVLESHQARPTALRSYIADKTTAGYAVQAILAALLARTNSGRGSRIDLSMLDVMAHFNFPDLFQERTFLDAAPRPVSPPNRPIILETRDGYVCLAPVRGRHISAAVTSVGHPEWTDDIKAEPDQARMITLLCDRMENETRTRTTAECLQLFRDHGVPATAVLSPDEHLDDPQTKHNGLYREGPSPVGPVRQVRHPLIWNGEPLPWVGPAPGGPDTPA